jgi:integrase
VILNFDSWIAQAKTKDSRERRQGMRDYVELLIDTGARPGKELMDLKWNQVKFVKHPESLRTGQKYVDDDGEEGEIVLTDLNRGVEMTVSGKTGTRVILGRNPSVKVLTRIAREHYAVENLIIDPLAGVAVPTNNDYVLRTKTHRIDPSSSFQKMLEDYLTEHNLLIDPVTGHKRVFYSFRHTYATLALTYDKVYGPILEEQMGTSQGMIKKHYSHIKVSEIFHELAGKESRRRIAESATVAELYKATNTTSKKPRT